MKRKRVTHYERLLVAVLVLPSMAQQCSFIDAIDPYADVDPATVVPPDPSEEPTGRYRSIDGTGNHETHFELGAANTPLLRLAPSEYADGISSMAGSRPSRSIAPSIITGPGTTPRIQDSNSTKSRTSSTRPTSTARMTCALPRSWALQY